MNIQSHLSYHGLPAFNFLIQKMNCMSNRDNAHDVDIFPDEKATKRSEPNKPSTNQDKYRERSSNFCYTLNPWEHMPLNFKSKEIFFKKYFWSKYFPATTNCRSRHSRVFLVKPVLKSS